MTDQDRAARTSRGARGSAATGHPAATAAALEVLRAGGNAVDAAVAAHAVLTVAMPDACGVGGDSLFLVRTPDGRVTAYNGTGAAPSAAPLPAPAPPVTAADGGASVTVPGSVRAWCDLLATAGRLPLDRVLAPAIALARDGLVVTAALTRAVTEQEHRLRRGGASSWSLLGTAAGARLVQPRLARVLEKVATEGAAGFYEGAVAEAVCRAVGRDGGAMAPADLAAHRTVVAEPVTVPWAGGRVHVQPPSSQGVLLAMALQWLDGRTDVVEPGAGHLDHLGVELTEAVFGFRDRCARDGAGLLSEPLDVDPARAARRGGPRPYLHTTGVAVADAEGTVVSSLLSVFDDFGAGTFVPEGGFVLNNRGAGFTAAPNEPGPGRRPVHTLAPALVEGPDGVTALATPGADGQVQTLLQVLTRVRFADADLATAVAASRWRSVESALLVEQAHPSAIALTGRGHAVTPVADGDPRFGAVVAATWHPDTTTAAVGDWRRSVSTGGI